MTGFSELFVLNKRLALRRVRSKAQGWCGSYAKATRHLLHGAGMASRLEMLRPRIS
jgi:hypothetical protein